MKTKFLSGILIIFTTIFIFIGCVDAQSKKNFQSVNTANPYGLFSLKAASQTPVEGSADANATPFSQDTRFQIAKNLGVSYLRLNVSLLGNTNLPEFDKARQLGFKIVLHVTTRETGGTASPQTDLTAYKKQLSALLDRYKPDVLAIENEEVAENFFAGTAEQYIAEMQAAIEVAHARGIKITNGAITTTPLAGLVYEDFIKRGMTAQAENFAQRTLVDKPNRLKSLNGKGRNTVFSDKIEKAQQFIDAYRTLPMDYVNFHWYFKDPKALESAVEYLRRATGKEVITTEMGQYDASPDWVNGVLQETKSLKLPIVIWFNGDGKRAVALNNLDGSLRENGKAFKNFVVKQ